MDTIFNLWPWKYCISVCESSEIFTFEAAYVPILLSEVEQEQRHSGNGDPEAIEAIPELIFATVRASVHTSYMTHITSIYVVINLLNRDDYDLNLRRLDNISDAVLLVFRGTWAKRTSLIALKKPNEELRPIAVSNTFRRLSAKCAGYHSSNHVKQDMEIDN